MSYITISPKIFFENPYVVKGSIRNFYNDHQHVRVIFVQECLMAIVLPSSPCTAISFDELVSEINFWATKWVNDCGDKLKEHFYKIREENTSKYIETLEQLVKSTQKDQPRGTLEELEVQPGDTIKGTRVGTGDPYEATISHIDEGKIYYEDGGFDYLESDGEFTLINRKYPKLKPWVNMTEEEREKIKTDYSNGKIVHWFYDLSSKLYGSDSSQNSPIWDAHTYYFVKD